MVELGVNEVQVDHDADDLLSDRTLSQYYKEGIKSITKKQTTLSIVANKLSSNDNLSLIRVPYYDPRTFVNSDRHQPDERQLEEIDPVFKVKQERVLKLRDGVPHTLESLLE